MQAFTIPWPCLDDNPKPQIQPKNSTNPQKSFVQALSNVCDIPSSQFPQPCFKGDRLAIPIPDEEYLAGVEACKHNLHGRIVWPKGSTPLTVVAVKNKLTPIWKDLSRWGITSLGKGFYEFSFSSLEDVRRVRSVASWNLNPGFLKLFSWTGDFNPNLQNNTTAQVWVRIYGLSQEYWRPKILFAIVSSIGTPICTDAIAAKPMFDRTFGHYARVLVDMDISQTPRYQVLVERKGYAFFVDLEYENLPDFCTHCNMIGHYVEICKKIQGKVNQEEIQPNEDRAKNKQKGESSKHYVQTRDNRNQNSNGIAENTSKRQPVLALQTSAAALKQAMPTITELVAPVDTISEPVLALQASAAVLKSMPTITKAPAVTTLINSNHQNINQQNMFSALAESDDNADMRAEVPILEPILVEVGRIDEQVDKNVRITENDVEIINAEDDSSSESDFVNETPPLINKGNSEDLSLQIVSQDQSQHRIQHDMQFLRDSWANMADDEELNHQLLEDLEADPVVSNFTEVTSKARKKAAASKTSTSKSIYGTRKVGPKKTFK